MHQYGKSNWEALWELLEREGNVGLDYVINPYLYPEIVHYLAERPKSFVVDFGCGTNLMGIQLLFGYISSIPALKNNKDIDYVRFNTLLYLGMEGSEEFVKQSHKYLSDIGNPKNIGTVLAHLDAQAGDLLDANSIDLCVSRNFLMHLPLEDFNAHFSSVSKALKPDSYYIFAVLNPEYEIKKIGRKLENGEKYEFLHGDHGERGTFHHYFKTQEYHQEAIKKYFSIEKRISCLPIVDIFKKDYARYYDAAVPMAYVYVLRTL